jgi:acyl dehydratase
MLDDLTSPLDLDGAHLGPVEVAVTADRVAFFADASGDDPNLWTEAAPPAFASVLLFAVADLFLHHPLVIPFTATLLHLDQSFAYLAPMRTDSKITMEGTITRVRERAGSYFVTFEATGSDEDGDVVQSTSTFVLSDQQAPAPPNQRTEPGARERGSNTGDMRSASRHDLVRYAAATRDFNPLHWDHTVAVEAGLAGTVVHGLLMYAWIVQAACRATGGAPVSAAKVRFRSALLPAEQATTSVEIDGAVVRCELRRGGEQLVTGTVTFDPDTIAAE